MFFAFRDEEGPQTQSPGTGCGVGVMPSSVSNCGWPGNEFQVKLFLSFLSRI